MSKRCNCRASSTSLICKKNYSFIINNKKYCFIHAKMLFNIYALCIQRIWYGQKIRRKLKNIYNKLPYDLQRKVLFHVRENYLIEKHHYKIIRNIITNKVHEDAINLLIYKLRNYTNELDIIYVIHKFSYIYYLFNKYNEIVPLDKIWFLRNRVFYLKYFGVLDLNHRFNEYPNDSFALAVMRMRSNVEKFQSIYCLTDLRQHNGYYY